MRAARPHGAAFPPWLSLIHIFAEQVDAVDFSLQARPTNSLQWNPQGRYAATADGKLVIGGLKPALHQFLRNAPHNHGCSFGQTGKQMGKPRRFHFAAAHLLFCILFQQAGKALFQFCLFHGSNLPGAVFPEDGFKKEVHYASVFQSIQGGGAPLFGCLLYTSRCV